MSDPGGKPISFESALKVADAAVFAKNSRHLKNIEAAILQGAWRNQKYDQIAIEHGYTPEYLKHDVGPKLWQLLSLSLGEKVSKSNLVAVLMRRADDPAEASIPLAAEPPIRPVPLGSPFYLERPPIESRCYEEIMRSGALIRIKAPSQMGKTSLMVRILDHARQQSGVQTVPLSLQRADSEVFTSLDRFLRWFCASVTRRLQLSHRVEDYWSDTFGSKGNCTAYLEDCILTQISNPLVIALDQVDELFLHPEIADDFFALLRSWYEEAAYGELGSPWQNLRFVIVHSTEVYIPLDINRSPFNVGLPIELQEFTPAQAIDLAQRHRLNLSPDQLAELMQLISGHPYLLRQAFYHLTNQDFSFDNLLQTAATDAGIYHNHLHRHLRNLQQHPDLAAAFQQVMKSATPVELDQRLAFKLHSMGLVTLQQNRVVLSYELYRRYFGENSLLQGA